MNWIIALTSVVVGLSVIALWLIIEIRQTTRDRKWELSCPIRDTDVAVYEITPPPPAPTATPGETQWERTLREVGDPAEVLTTGDEFAMPEAK